MPTYICDQPYHNAFSYAYVWHHNRPWLWLTCSTVNIIVNCSATVPEKDTGKSDNFQPQQGANQEHIDGLVQDCSNSIAIAVTEVLR